MNKKTQKFIVSLILFLVVLTYYYYIEPKIQKNVLNTPTPTTSSSRVLSAQISESPNATCHTINVNPQDSQAYLPDPNCTPGSVDPAVTQENLKTTICKSGYTKTVRPSESYTEKLKIQQIKEYGYTDTKLSDYEEDHFISLELGGSPSDPKNLWPEPHASTNEKDKVENYLNDQVCSGAISLSQAQSEIQKNWYNIYQGAITNFQ